jgi:hypothetical protein
VKPDNVYLHNDKILLNDWGSAVQLGRQDAIWEGTYGFSVHPQEEGSPELSTKSKDLISLVRCCYVLLFKEWPPSDSAQAAEHHWEGCFREGTYWRKAILLAEKLQYEELGNFLGKMK